MECQVKTTVELSVFYNYSVHILRPGPAPSKRGNLGPVPAPVAWGCHGPLKHCYLPDLGRYRTWTTRAMD